MAWWEICPDCNELMVRSRRSQWERLWVKATFSCSACGLRRRIHRLDGWKITPFVRCPECETSNLRALRRRDYVDRLNRNPFRHLARLFKAHLYCCGSCRLQFYDVRRLKPPHHHQEPAAFPVSRYPNR